MNYKIIYDVERLQEFIDWLPELLPNEQYYIALLARKKYSAESDLTTDKNQMKRVTATKDRIIQKIRQMECEVGSYTTHTKDNGPIHQDNLCVYITPNPRDLTKASLVLMKMLADRLLVNDINYNPHSMALNAIQITTSRKIYFDLDVDFIRGQDFRDYDINAFRNDLSKLINIDCVTFIRTNGGLHCLINLQNINKEYQKSWYRNIDELSDGVFYTVTMNSDNIIPIPGCVQGKDFSPILINGTFVF